MLCCSSSRIELSLFIVVHRQVSENDATLPSMRLPANYPD
jgi:hypothetical protein